MGKPSIRNTDSTILIDSIAEALAYFVHGKDYESGKVIHGSKGIIGMIIYVQKSSPLQVPYMETHYVFYNRRCLHGLQRVCLQVPESHGDKAQTVQLAALKEAAEQDAIIDVVMQDGTILGARARDWLGYGEAYQTIRIPKGETLEEVHYPVSKMILFSPEKEQTI